jgi:hypothetical protein
MKRREFITLLGAAAAWPLAARAQEPEKIRRVGVLSSLSDSDPEVKIWLKAFQDQLQRLGWEQGRNIRIEQRSPRQRSTPPAN